MSVGLCERLHLVGEECNGIFESATRILDREKLVDFGRKDCRFPLIAQDNLRSERRLCREPWKRRMKQGLVFLALDSRLASVEPRSYASDIGVCADDAQTNRVRVLSLFSERARAIERNALFRIEGGTASTKN